MPLKSAKSKLSAGQVKARFSTIGAGIQPGQAPIIVMAILLLLLITPHQPPSSQIASVQTSGILLTLTMDNIVHVHG